MTYEQAIHEMSKGRRIVEPNETALGFIAYLNEHYPDFKIKIVINHEAGKTSFEIIK